MLISMTGFGQGEASDEETTVSVELRTVNHRFLDYSIKMPRPLHHRERDIKEVIREKLTRGRIYVTVSVDSNEDAATVTLNTLVMKRYLKALREFAKENDVAGDVDMNTLAGLPDVFRGTEPEQDDDALWSLVKTALTQAIDRCMVMRTEEGKAMEADMVSRMQSFDGIVAEIEKLAPGVVKKHGEEFRKRLDQYTGGVPMDNDRLMTEIALLADRLDISEEITRLNSHIAQFKKCLGDGGEVSKKLTYLLQEMHREASTIGAKAADSEVIQRVVSLKEETEKLREQAQNIE